ncbi:MAG: hypothetical protein IPF63_08755 [Bacteroidetes bacterium]|nr:hypothetical protein [Bacteroidota bacterium]
MERQSILEIKAAKPAIFQMEIAGLILEPIQAEGGEQITSEKGLCKHCDRYVMKMKSCLF